jgi:hypothetical protein
MVEGRMTGKEEEGAALYLPRISSRNVTRLAVQKFDR